MSFIKTLTRNIDWKLWSAIVILMGAGLLSLLSADSEIFYKQLLWIVIGFVGVFIFITIDFRSFFGNSSASFVFYSIVNALLLATLIFAPQIKGNRAWILIGGFQFQPAELAKMALVCVLAVFFAKRHIGIGRWNIIIRSFLYTLVPAGIIALQPDMGSALIILGVWFGFLLVSGIPLKRIVVAVAIFAGVCAFLWTSVLQEYQKDRIVGLFDPQYDPLGVNYNVIQSKIALGAGGWLGQGFGQGIQTQLGFLPEAQTDFIFAAITEEGGVLAAGIVLVAFLWMIARLLHIGMLLEGNAQKFICLGVAILFLLQFILNVGSVVGFLPVIGVTFPFVSYGGSSMIVNLMLVGLVQSFYSRR
jgi:rod shape determining protein RodA